MRTTPEDRSYIIKVLAVFCLGWTVVYADRTVLYPMLDIIGKDLSLSSTQTGAITSAFFLFYVAMQVPAGLWGDKYGLKRVLVVMFFVAGVGMLLTGIASYNYITLLMFVSLHGIGAGAYFPAALGTTLNTVPREMRGMSTAIVNSGISLGLALGLISAGPIFTSFNSWRTPFLILSVPTFITAFIYQLVLRDVRPPKQKKAPFIEILREKNLMFINAANFCSHFGFWTVVTWGPSFFQTERNLSLTVAGLYTAIIALTSIPAALTIGRFSDRLGRKRLSLILLPLAAVSVFATGYVKSLPILVVVLVIYGLIGKLTLDPILVAWSGDHIAATRPQTMGSAIAFFNFCGMSSAIVAPLIAGWLRDMTGSLQTSFYLGGAIVLLGTFLLVFVDETVK